MTRTQKEILAKYKIKDLYPKWWEVWKKDNARFLRGIIPCWLIAAEIKHQIDYHIALCFYQTHECWQWRMNEDTAYCPDCKELVEVSWTGGRDSYSVECPFCSWLFDED